MTPRRTAALSALFTLGLLASTAHAVRPTEGGLFSFDETDVIESWDEPAGLVRVHYSVDGPNATLLADLDADGAPDFAQDVATTAAQVLAFYDSRGLRAPVSEAALGLGPLGGSDALDIYLVDFGGNADGAFGLDACDGATQRCAGFLTIENDFVGYGYPSLQLAIDILTSHELFHGVQHAYAIDVPIWVSEGTAVWAERLYDPDSVDFMAFSSAYLDDAARSIDRPPAGPVPAFAYGTGLFWDFLAAGHGEPIIGEVLDAIGAAGPDPDALAVIEEVIGGPEVLRADWLAFAAANLATGARAGAAGAGETHPYAASLRGVTAEVQGDAIDDTNRFYSMATTYYRISHAGGPLYFGVEDAAPGLVFALHPVEDGLLDGPVEAEIDTFAADRAESFAVAGGADLPAGGYWLWGALPDRGADSIRVRLCAGDLTAATACAPLAQDPVNPPPPPPTTDPGGCAAAGGTGNPGAAWFIALAFLALCTRRSRTGAATFRHSPRVFRHSPRV